MRSFRRLHSFTQLVLFNSPSVKRRQSRLELYHSAEQNITYHQPTHVSISFKWWLLNTTPNQFSWTWVRICSLLLVIESFNWLVTSPWSSHSGWKSELSLSTFSSLFNWNWLSQSQRREQALLRMSPTFPSMVFPLLRYHPLFNLFRNSSFSRSSLVFRSFPHHGQMDQTSNGENVERWESKV